MYQDLRQAFTGGSVDVYKPSGENIKVYDVNSIYPSQMKNCCMPVGNPIYFEGDISQFENINDLFGIFEVEITSPTNLAIPILQLRFKFNNITNTISPLGT